MSTATGSRPPPWPVDTPRGASRKDPNAPGVTDILGDGAGSPTNASRLASKGREMRVPCCRYRTSPRRRLFRVHRVRGDKEPRLVLFFGLAIDRAEIDTGHGHVHRDSRIEKVPAVGRYRDPVHAGAARRSDTSSRRHGSAGFRDSPDDGPARVRTPPKTMTPSGSRGLRGSRRAPPSGL